MVEEVENVSPVKKTEGWANNLSYLCLYILKSCMEEGGNSVYVSPEGRSRTSAWKYQEAELGS